MIRTIVFTFLVGIGLFLVDYFRLPWHIHQDKWIILVFFIFLHFLQEIFVTKSFANNRKHFVQMQIANTIGRFLFCAIFVGIWLYKGVDTPHSFVITFFVLYLFYTSFEISETSRKLRRDLKP